MTNRWRLRWLALALASLAWSHPGRAGAEKQARPHPPAPGLAAVKTLAADTDVFLVSPRWSPRGDFLLASGYLGVGLYKIRLADLDKLEEIDPAIRAEPHFAPDGRTVALHLPGGDDDFLEVDLESGERRSVGRPAYAGRLPEASESAFSRVVRDDGTRRILYDERLGVLAAAEGGHETRLAEKAWSVLPSPDGRWIAYTTGSLEEPVLHVADLAGGDRLLGRGTQPSWFPDSSRIVYAVPEGFEAGERAFERSDLFVYSLERGSARPLAITAEVVEMNPDVSPRGDWIAFADWRSGTIQVVRTTDVPELWDGGAP